MKSVTHEFYRMKRITENRRCWTEMSYKAKRQSLSQTDESQKKDKKNNRPKTAKEDKSAGQYPYTSTCFELFICGPDDDRQ